MAMAAVVASGAAFAAEGPALEPAAYKPLPVGTKVRYDDRNLQVTESDGFRTVFRVWIGGRKAFLRTHAVFGEYANDLYAYRENGQPLTYEIEEAGKRNLESLWPLEVGKETTYRLMEGSGGWSGQQAWTISVKVAGTEQLTVGDVSYPTFVIEEQAQSTGGMSFVRRKWYEPGSGLVIKSAKTWTGKFRVGGGKTSYLDVNDQEVFEIAAVAFPEGTTTHALKGTKAVTVDPALMAELEKLKRTVQEVKSTSQVAGEAAPVAVEGIAFGVYHALVIGINDYKHLPKLETAVRDAKAVAQVLRGEYNFKVKLLINPKRVDIIDALDEFRESLGSDDNLLIYYAGHGWLDEDADRGYWLPADAKSNRRARWVSNATITDTLKTLQAKHVMIVADSCYSGTLTRSANIGLRSGDYFKRMAKKWARVALVSGGLEPVADEGGGGHSPFAKAFIDALRENDTVIDGTQLFGKLRRPVMVSARQTPEYSDVRNAGHDGGDFLFVRKK